MISDRNRELPGPFTYTHMHTRIRTHLHAHAPTRADEVNKIAESRWQNTHTHARIHTQTCSQNYRKVAAKTNESTVPR